MEQIKITLKRSPIGRTQKHRNTIRGLGLKKIHQTVVRNGTPEIWGMIHKIPHLVDVEKVTD